MSTMPRWWRFAEERCAALTEPDDAAVMDRDLERLLASSRIGSAVGSVLGKLRIAWTDSRCRAIVQKMVES